MGQTTALRPSLTGMALVRLLEGLVDPRAQVREARATFADGLVQWMGWADAIALSAALDRPPGQGGGHSDGGVVNTAASERAECSRVRGLMARAIAREVSAAGRLPMEAGMGYAPFRQRYLARQQAMEIAIGALRERVRAAVAMCSPAMGRLAAVDAAMAQVLSAPERRLLATVPALLDRHYQRLREAHAAAPGGADDSAWVELFRRDLQTVLLAELDLRLQPVDGLMEALSHPLNPAW